MENENAAGEGQVKADLFKDGENILLEKLSTLYTQCLLAIDASKSSKNADIVLFFQETSRAEETGGSSYYRLLTKY